MKHATIVPLIGGMTVAAKQVTGGDPQFFLSYKPFGENEKNAKAYFPKVPHYLLDEPDFGGFKVDEHKDLDFVQAVCPCAGLSLLSSGSEEQRAGMNSWMLNSARYITGVVRPKVFWGENAPALYTKGGEQVRNQLREIAAESGYSFSIYCTNTEFHGIPQSRKRTFYFFWRDTGAPVFEYYRRDRKSLTDYLDEVPADVLHHKAEDLEIARRHLLDNPYTQFLQEKYKGDGINQIRNFLKKKDKRGTTMLSYLLLTEQLEEARDWFQQKSGEKVFEKAFRESTRVLHKVSTKGGFWDGSFPLYQGDGTYATLIARTLYGIHPREDRVLTTRECMHLMGLPHDFELVNGQQNNICQNVPVCTASDMVREVVAYVNGQRQITTASFLMQSNLTERVDVQQSSLLSF